MRVALTFDDGPSEWTDPILDLLADHQAKATFFVLGLAVIERGGTVMRAAYDGHEIGNHTFEHERLTELTDAEVRLSLKATSGAVAAVTGKTPKLFRAPHFDADDRVYAIGREMGLTRVGCDVDPSDWNASENDIVDRVLAGVRSERTIVDLHDGIPPGGGTGFPHRENTVGAVGSILNLLPDVEFVTVSQLWA